MGHVKRTFFPRSTDASTRSRINGRISNHEKWILESKAFLKILIYGSYGIFNITFIPLFIFFFSSLQVKGTNIYLFYSILPI